MPTRSKPTQRIDREDVDFFWSGGRNVTWRMTLRPTGIFVEGSTQLTDATFTKKRLRIAEEKLKDALLRELEVKVLRQARTRS